MELTQSWAVWKHVNGRARNRDGVGAAFVSANLKNERAMTAPQLYRSRVQARGLVRLQVTVSAQNLSLIRGLVRRSGGLAAWRAPPLLGAPSD